jgi:hypothetical protein
VARPDVYIRSEKCRTRFENEVVADAQRRGLSREALDSVVVMALTAAAIVPGLLAWSVWEFEAGLGTFFGALALLYLDPRPAPAARDSGRAGSRISMARLPR